MEKRLEAMEMWIRINAPGVNREENKMIKSCWWRVNEEGDVRNKNATAAIYWTRYEKRRTREHSGGEEKQSKALR